jgi:chitinase
LKRRLFLLSGSASAVATALTACGGGGGAAIDTATGSVDTTAAGSTVGTATAATPGTAATATPTTVTDPGTAPAQPTAQPTTRTASTASATGGLPAKILACYFTAWDTSYRITDVPTDFNVIYLFNAQNSGTNSGDGSWTWPFSGNVTSAQIQQVRQRGQKVILTIGGAGLGFVYTNRTQSTNCVNSLKSIISQIGGVDGVDFNNYEAGILTAGNLSAMCTEMVWIAQQLRATYGSDFAITSPAAPNETTGQQLMLALKNAGMLTYAAPQYYDWSGFNAVGYIKNATDTWVSLLGDSFVGVGFSANYSNGPSLSDCTREWAAIKAAHPNIRGMFCWSAQTNISGGNGWGSAMKAALG